MKVLIRQIESFITEQMIDINLEFPDKITSSFLDELQEKFDADDYELIGEYKMLERVSYDACEIYDENGKQLIRPKDGIYAGLCN